MPLEKDCHHPALICEGLTELRLASSLVENMDDAFRNAVKAPVAEGRSRRPSVRQASQQHPCSSPCDRPGAIELPLQGCVSTLL